MTSSDYDEMLCGVLSQALKDKRQQLQILYDDLDDLESELGETNEEIKELEHCRFALYLAVHEDSSGFSEESLRVLEKELTEVEEELSASIEMQAELMTKKGALEREISHFDMQPIQALEEDLAKLQK